MDTKESLFITERIMSKEEITNEFVKRISDTYALNLAISILEDNETLKISKRALETDNRLLAKKIEKLKKEIKEYEKLLKR